MRWSLLALLALACAHARPSGAPLEEDASDWSSPEPRSSPRALRHYLDADFIKPGR